MSRSLPPLLLLLISVAGIAFHQRAEAAQQDLLDAVGELLPGFDDVVSTQLELSTASQVGTGVVGGSSASRSCSCSSPSPSPPRT